MHSTYTVTSGLLVLIFVAGFMLGWIISKVREGGSANGMSADLAQQAMVSSSSTRAITSKHFYELKCKCGQEIKFHGAHETGSGDVPPLPESESYACPKCGFVFDLQRLRDLAKRKIAV